MAWEDANLAPWQDQNTKRVMYYNTDYNSIDFSQYYVSGVRTCRL